MWFQKEFQLKARPRGFHLITGELEQNLPELQKLEVGLANIFIQHTSASLTINENADPSVRADFERFFNQCVPEGASYFEHVDEGPDDMPAHIKTSLLSCSLTIPISSGRLKLGTWQGVYLCEHRNYGGSRRVVVTLNGTDSLG